MHTVSSAETLRVSELGHDPEDSTRFLQAAFDSTAAVVIVDNVPGGWSTGPLFVRRSDVTIVFEPGVVVRAKPGAMSGLNDCLVDISNQSRVRLSGYGATLMMNKREYADDTAWRMGLIMFGVSDVVVEGLTLQNAGGDGVYLGRGEDQPYCSDVVLRDLVCVNNLRQAISVVSADGLRIEGCALLDSNGSEPESGIAFRPNYPDERLAGIVVRDCSFHGNLSSQTLLDGSNLQQDSHPVDILIDQCLISTLASSPPQVMINARHVFPGTFEMQSSLLQVGEGSHALEIMSTSQAGMRTKVTRTTMWDWGSAREGYEPVVLLSHGQLQHGNVTIHDSVMVTDQQLPFLHTGVSGTAADQDDRLSSVVVSPSSATVTGGRPATIVFTREGGSTHLPLAIAYTTGGTARERYDYGGLAKVAVIPPGEDQVIIPIRTFARRDEGLEPRWLTVEILDGPGYRNSLSSTRIEITDEGIAAR